MEQTTRFYLPDTGQQPACRPKVRFVEDIYPADFSEPAHAHRVAGLYFVLRGVHKVTCRNLSHLAEPGNLVYHPAGEPHRCLFPMEAKILEMYVEPSWIERLLPPGTMLDRPSCHGAGTLTQLARRVYDEFHNQDAFTPLALEGLVLEILAGIARHDLHGSETTARKPPRWLRETHDLLHERFAESLTLDDIAEAVGVHPAHLGRMFRRYYHGTVGEYLRGLRLNHACRLLVTSALPLAQIALACGYAEQSNFTTAFKRHTGLTPKEYRKTFPIR